MSSNNADQATMLAVRSLDVRFGGVVAVNNVSFDVPRGKVLGLVGPNGAGKTTCFNAITGMVHAQGSISFQGKEIMGLRPDLIAQSGIARTFQHVAVIPEMSVRDNILVGAYRHGKLGWVRNGLRLGTKTEEAEAKMRTEAAIETMGLQPIANRLCSDLGLPHLKLVEIARALAFDASLLLLDEPANGLTHSEVSELVERINSFKENHNLTIVIVEHHMGMIRAVADHLVVLNFGSLLTQGDPATVLSRPEVIEAYLGVKA